MNLDILAKRIENPSTCQASELEELRLLAEKYPYTQLFSILYLKALSNQRDIRFEETLQAHAFRITDRKKLYQLIHEQADTKVEVESIETNEDLSINEISDLNENEEFKPVSVPIEDEIVKIVEVELETEATLNEQDNQPIEEEEEISQSDSIEIENESVEKTWVEDVVDLDILSEIANTAYVENLAINLPETTSEKADQKEVEKPISLIENKENHINIKENHSFTDWLKLGSNKAENLSHSNKQTEEKPVEKENEAIARPEAKTNPNELIDKFIREEPRISKPKKEFYSPTKKAKESLAEEGMIFTETLANIFVLQGNFPKAISAYEQLMLTIPEKKIYFAARIEELKAKLNT